MLTKRNGQLKAGDRIRIRGHLVRVRCDPEECSNQGYVQVTVETVGGAVWTETLQRNRPRKVVT
jgi:hypothetical protein